MEEPPGCWAIAEKVSPTHAVGHVSYDTYTERSEATPASASPGLNVTESTVATAAEGLTAEAQSRARLQPYKATPDNQPMSSQPSVAQMPSDAGIQPANPASFYIGSPGPHDKTRDEDIVRRLAAVKPAATTNAADVVDLVTIKGLTPAVNPPLDNPTITCGSNLSNVIFLHRVFTSLRISSHLYQSLLDIKALASF